MGRGVRFVIPMAGYGRRFDRYDVPKPWVDVAGVSMIDRVVRSLIPADKRAQFEILTRATVGPTRGTVDTLLRGGPYDPGPVVVANCDQVLGEGEIDRFLDAVRGHRVGALTTERSPDGLGGVYYFDDSLEMTQYAQKVIDAGVTVDGEFPMPLLLDAYLRDGPAVLHECSEFWSLGTPEDVARFTR